MKLYTVFQANSILAPNLTIIIQNTKQSSFFHNVLFKQNRLYVVKDNVKLFDHEIYNYVWKDGADEPVKADDDFLDSLRYSLFSYIALLREDDDDDYNRRRR